MTRIHAPKPGRLPRQTWAGSAPLFFMLYVSLIVFLVAYIGTGGAYWAVHPLMPSSTVPGCPLMKFQWSGLHQGSWA